MGWFCVCGKNFFFRGIGGVVIGDRKGEVIFYFSFFSFVSGLRMK